MAAKIQSPVDVEAEFTLIIGKTGESKNLVVNDSADDAILETDVANGRVTIETLLVDGDNGGVAGMTGITNTTDETLSTGAGSVKMKTANPGATCKQFIQELNFQKDRQESYLQQLFIP